MRERTIFVLIVVALLLLGLGYWSATNLDLMPQQASTRAVVVDQLFRILLGVATVIFLLVEGALVFAILRFRARPDDVSDAEPYHGNNSLEIIWTLIPALIVLVIGVYSFRVLTQIERQPDSPMVVEVIGRQFSWEFRYPQEGISSAVLHLPVDQTVRFEITSEDVIHSFWVPAFRAKRDATPGQISDLVITPNDIGIYPIRCAELCGVGHANMVADVIVESRADFEAWVASVSSIPEDPIEAGRFVYEQYGCGACHALSDYGSVAVVGPELDGIGERGATTVEGLDARGYILQSIINPNAYLTPGFQANLMPQNFGDRMSEQELDILVDYLLEQ